LVWIVTAGADGARAEHADVVVILNGDKLVVAGGPVFEGNIREFVLDGGATLRTDDPGFNTPTTPTPEFPDAPYFDPGNDIGFNAVGPLLFWGGSTWESTVPNGERCRVFDLGHATGITVTSATTTESGWDFIEADSGGGFHQHLYYELTRADAGIPSTGAYAIEIELTSPQYDTSDSWFIAFNNDLSEPSFEDAVDALLDLVTPDDEPVPAMSDWGLPILAVGLVGVMALATRKRACRT